MTPHGLVLSVMPTIFQVSVLLLLLTFNVTFSSSITGTRRNALNTAHPHAVQRAEVALGVLQGLSDTGIYRTLSLKRILEAVIQEGVFHSSTLLTLELASPYFASGLQAEKFDVAVMESKEDGRVSLSIDSFPAMDAKATEEFYIQHVEQHRQARRLFWSKAEREANGDAWAEANVGTSNPAKLAVGMMNDDTDHLHQILRGGFEEENPAKQAAKNELERRLDQRTAAST